ncbi:CAP domain-containing protein [Caldibacillus lycopersici]|uniref:CAP domain-containing protein n=1 Tax=Perspicuibacillus lycopersici TaxID=1325689 RepID=A0AAE3IS02_9BACI|nr:CAP domain-containing protein [Perspicuibacillus lycopersici]MCU9613553.1 CAP domain-containing protein [Perspicuibacillus lycopersici]
MRKLLLLAAIFVLFFSGAGNASSTNSENATSFLDHIQSGIATIKDHIDTEAIMNTIADVVQTINQTFDRFTNNGEEQNTNNAKIEKLNLETPTTQIFSVSNIELGDTKESVIKQFGKPDRSSLNEYGVDWDTYHDNYKNFFMVMYDEKDHVAGLYTNQALVSSTNGITIGKSTKDNVIATMGEPLQEIRKGFVMYELPEDRDYDMFSKNNSYITIFYDKHENNSVSAIQLISEELEEQKQDFYTKASDSLIEGFEYQLFDLTNAARVEHGLSVLTWDEHVRATARKHSEDMAVNNYFDHTNLEGKSPFDRMKDDNIFFLLAGENLAYGQFSSIFAHEGLMNSLGHRENILQKDFEYLGVGVAFNSEAHPYYTENFYAK